MEKPKEYPIAFSAIMLKAIRAGQKTQTRRLVTPPPISIGHCQRFTSKGEMLFFEGTTPESPGLAISKCPYGPVGSTLWVKETIFRNIDDYTYYEGDEEPDSRIVKKDGRPLGWEWKPNSLPAMFMPRFACRVFLRSTAVRVERLQDIAGQDAKAEGVSSWVEYGILWDTLSGKKPGCSWQDNPFVWVVDFELASSNAG